jgi:uncharacterized protein YjbJ (UPF0337 family)
LNATGTSSGARCKEQWSALTEDHLDQIAGERDVLSAKLQDFYGISKDAADAQIDAFSAHIKGAS